MVKRILLRGDSPLGHDISIILPERKKGNYTSKEVYHHAKGFYFAGKRCIQNIVLKNGLTESLIFPSSVIFYSLSNYLSNDGYCMIVVLLGKVISCANYIENCLIVESKRLNKDLMIGFLL